LKKTFRGGTEKSDLNTHVKRIGKKVGKKETTSFLYFIRELRQAFTAV
jgi:hypothetical protein